MCVRVFLGTGLLVLCVVAVGIAWGQAIPPVPNVAPAEAGSGAAAGNVSAAGSTSAADRERLLKQLDDIAKQVGEIRHSIFNPPAGVAMPLPPPGDSSRKAAGASAGTPATQAEVDVLWDKLDRMDKDIEKIKAAVGKIDVRVAGTHDLKRVTDYPFADPDKSGNSVALVRKAHLRLQNQIGQERALRVNGTEYRIPAYETLAVDVPAGVVVYELPGEGLKTLVVPADYMQPILIQAAVYWTR